MSWAVLVELGLSSPYVALPLCVRVAARTAHCNGAATCALCRTGPGRSKARTPPPPPPLPALPALPPRAPRHPPLPSVRTRATATADATACHPAFDVDLRRGHGTEQSSQPPASLFSSGIESLRCLALSLPAPLFAQVHWAPPSCVGCCQGDRHCRVPSWIRAERPRRCASAVVLAAPASSATAAPACQLHWSISVPERGLRRWAGCRTVCGISGVEGVAGIPNIVWLSCGAGSHLVQRCLLARAPDARGGGRNTAHYVVSHGAPEHHTVCSIPWARICP